MKIKLIIMALLIGTIGFTSGCGESEKPEEKKKLEKKKEKKEYREDSKKVAVLVTEGFDDGEAYMPIGYLVNRGIKVCVIGPKVGEVKAYNSEFTIMIEKAVADVKVDYFDALILPGGKAPASLRQDETVVNFVKEFFETGKPTAAICHGPQVLITAGVMEGKTSTAFSEVKSELEEAGATYKDEALVIDGNLITSRVPKDLHDFSRAIYKALKK